MKVTVEVRKEIGTANDSSIGASCRIEDEIEPAVADDEQYLLDHRRKLYAHAWRSVNEELDRQRAAEPEPHHEPERESASARNGNGYTKERNRWGRGDGNVGRERDRRDDRGQAERRRGRSDDGNAGRPPRTGKQFMAWAKGMEEQDSDLRGLWDAVTAWAKKQRMPWKCVEWTEREVEKAVAFVEDWLANRD